MSMKIKSTPSGTAKRCKMINGGKRSREAASATPGVHKNIPQHPEGVQHCSQIAIGTIVHKLQMANWHRENLLAILLAPLRGAGEILDLPGGYARRFAASLTPVYHLAPLWGASAPHFQL